MKKTILAIAATSLLSTTAMAGVAEKKAIRSASANIVAQAAKTQLECGNETFDVSVDWDNVNTMIKNNKDALKSDNYKGVWVIGHTGERTVAALKAMSKICKDDADYKEEIANVTNVMVTAKAKFGDSKSTFSIEETTINVESGHRMTRNQSNFINPIKALF